MGLRPITLPFIVALGIVSAACGPSRAQQNATSTSNAWSIIQTVTAAVPAASPMATQTATPTPTPGPTPTWTPQPVPPGWKWYNGDDFRIALPDRWIIVQVDEMSIASLIAQLAASDEEWARSLASALGSGQATEGLQLVANDPIPTGGGTAIVTVNKSPTRAGSDLNYVCMMLPVMLDLMGAEFLTADCLLTVADFDAALFVYRAKVGAIQMRSHQYDVFAGRTTWTITVAFPEEAADRFADLSQTIALSFAPR